MEFIDGKTIDKYLSEYEELDSILCDDPTPDNIFVQLIDAFSYMEKHHIIHRDIREGNIMIDKSGTVKVIDFGIGKLVESTQADDSLRSQINRRNADTLPQEYYDKEYTSLTDMFYLAELLNRLMREAEHPDEMNFSYQSILDKMMQKKPEDRYSSFEEIRKAISKRGFVALNISEEDKKIYHSFVDNLYKSLTQYTSERQFNTSPESFSEKLQKALQSNIFEEYIQKNADVISSVVSCSYRYDNSVGIPCEAVKAFLTWYESYSMETKELILQNIISKLSYKTKAPYGRIGMDFNLMKNKHDIYRIYGGFRYAYTSFKFDVEGNGITDPVWGDQVEYSAKGIKASYHWLEAVFGLDAKIWGPIRLGWSFRYKRRLIHNDGSIGSTWYVPGYGKQGGTRLGGTFNISIEL